MASEMSLNDSMYMYSDDDRVSGNYWWGMYISPSMAFQNDLYSSIWPKTASPGIVLRPATIAFGSFYGPNMLGNFGHWLPRWVYMGPYMAMYIMAPVVMPHWQVVLGLSCQNRPLLGLDLWTQIGQHQRNFWQWQQSWIHIGQILLPFRPSDVM